jgi:predicted dehydrogenase
MHNRREFLYLSGSAILMSTTPSEQISVGLIGSGGRGRFLTKIFLRDPAIKVVAVCDVYEPNLREGLVVSGGQAKEYRNYRALLQNKEVDVVIIATPEHWHYRMLLDALSAGKDIYIEKPLCQTPEQGVEMLAVGRSSKSVVQVGMQRRSYDLYLRARQTIADGTLGTVRMVRSWWLNNYLQVSHPATLGGHLDWEEWQGPAARFPLDPARFFDWRNYPEYSGGIMADQGAHVFDGIHMLMNAGFPTAVNASAGRPHKPGIQLPESVIVAAEYREDFLGVFTINYAAMKYKGIYDQLNQLDGNKARLDVGRESFQLFRQGEETAPALSGTSGGFSKATEDHVDNFLKCIRNRTTPTAPLEKGFQAVLVTQLANLSLRQGRRIKWNLAENKWE